MHNPQLYRKSRTAVALMAAASAMPVITTVANAGEGGSGYSSLAQREMIRRQNDVAEADRLLLEGRQAFANNDFQQAVDKYSQALQKLPETPIFADRRQSYADHLADASVALSMQHRKVGKYTEARTLLDNVLAVDPNNALAKRELGYLDDPIRTNPALTYEHTQNVDKVRRSLYTAEGNFNLGKYDAANREYQEVLRVDPYNSAARRGMEQVAAAKSDYYRAAYDHTRAELLSQVDAAWEMTVPPELPNLPIGGSAGPGGQEGVAYITDKLRRIIIPRIDFEDTSLEEAIDFLRLRASELDTLELDPARKGINFVINRPRDGGGAGAGADAGVDAGAGGGLPLGGSDPSSLKIRELRLRNVPLEVALKYIADETGLRIKIDNFAVKLVPQSQSGEDIFTRTFTVPPDFSSSLEGSTGGGGEAAGAADPFAEEGAGGSALKARRPIIELLKASGITFGEGTSATLSTAGVLLVTNTPTELDKVEQLVTALKNKQPKQVKITTKFVEITQENSEELGFDWIIGPFELNSADSLIGSGGTLGNGTPRTGNDFSAGTGASDLLGLPLNPENTVSNIVTGGNRSGDGAIVGNSIDGILNNPNRATQASNVAPGILSLTGILADGEFQMIMRGVSQKKGVDLMTAPSITAKSGQKATIEIIREFIYPTEYEPPEVPQGGGGENSVIAPVVTPATPTAFETRNTGVTLEIEPTIGENDFMIDLQFAPEIVEFEGFINYGSPIQASTQESMVSTVFEQVIDPITGLITGVFRDVVTTVPRTVTLTENRIEMPVFSTRRVNTAITIYDGYTVSIGGLMREDVQDVEDKVPILGDIPFIGRLFQSDAEKRIKSNLIIFVTSQIIDATGRPLRGADAGATIPAATGGGAENLDGVLPPL
jgi:general secretion pathway protein D